MFATLWLTLYFVLASTPGRTVLADTMRGATPPGLDVEVVQWGPAPGALVIGGVTIRDHDRPLVRIDAARAELSLAQLFAFATGGDLELERVEVDLAFIRARLDEEGRLDVLTALRPERTASSPGGSPRRGVLIHALAFRCDELTFDGPQVGIDFRDVSATSAIRLPTSALPSLSGRLRTGRAHVAWNRRVVGFDALTLERLELSGTRLDLDAGLSRAGQDILSGRFRIDMVPPRVEAILSADLAPYDIPSLAQALPLGLELDHATLTFADGQLSGAIGALRTPLLEVPPLSVADINLALPTLRFEKGTLLPRVELTLSHLGASRITWPGGALEGVDIGHGHVSLDKRVDLSLGPGRATSWNAGEDLGPADLALIADLGLTGGPVQLRLATQEGLVDALGALRVSLLRKRTDFNLTLLLAEASPRLLAAALPPIEATSLSSFGRRSHAEATLEIDLAVDGKSLEAEWVSGEISPANGTPFLLEDGRWTTPQAAAAAPRAETAP